MTYFASYPVTEEQRDETKIIDGVMTVNVTEQQETLMKQMLSAFEQSGLWQVATELRIMETDVRLLISSIGRHLIRHPGTVVLIASQYWKTVKCGKPRFQ